MKIEVDVKKFSDAFCECAAVAPMRSPKEILQNVKLTATNGSLVFEATNMELSIRVTLNEGYSVAAEGAILLPARWMMALLRECTDDTITLEEDGSVLHIVGRASRFRVPTANADEFPSATAFESENYFVLEAREFASALRRTIVCCDEQSSRFALGGVLLSLGDARSKAIATDGRRLATHDFLATKSGDPEAHDRVIVPHRAALSIIRALGSHEGTVDVAATTNSIVFRIGSTDIYARLLEGKFPDWRKVVPSDADAVLTNVGAGSLGALIRQAAIVTDRESKGIDFSLKGGEIVLESQSPDLGSSVVRMPCSIEGEEQSVSLDNTFVQDFCKACAAEDDVTIGFNGNGPARFKQGEDYVYIVMPMAKS